MCGSFQVLTQSCRGGNGEGALPTLLSIVSVEAVRKGDMTQDDFTAAEACMSRSRGHCNTMGTASTMACIAESLGMTLTGNAAIPAADARRNRIAQMSGRRAVEMVREGLTIDKILTRDAFENAIVALSAIGKRWQILECCPFM